MERITPNEEFGRWLARTGDEHIVFERAYSRFDREKDLPDICAALANGGGGKLLLGVTGAGEVTGSAAFRHDYSELPGYLFRTLGIGVEVEEFMHPQGRVLIFHVPPRPGAAPVRSPGRYRYPVRAGKSLTEMDIRPQEQ